MNKQKSYLMYVFWPAQIIALLAIIFTTPNWLFLFLGWVLFCGLGSAVILHRVISHKSIKIKDYLKNPLLLLATLCIQGSPLWWAAVHRNMHHRNADKEGDPHSPKDGLVHAYIGWIHDPKITNINLKSIRDIIRDKFHLFLYKYNNLIIWLTFIILGLINFEFMLWFWLIPAAWSYHQESLVNVICHTAKVGYKTYNTSDNAVNIPLLALITWGQALHNNHHYDTKSYNFAKNKKEFDPSVIFLPFIEEKTR